MTDYYIGAVPLAIFGLVGAWAVVNPNGIIGWLKQVHSTLDQNDPQVRSVVKFIGAWFILLSLFGLIVSARNR
jgi:hypothetical protein